MKSLAIATVLALAGFASLTATASADHYSNNYYRGSGAGAACGPNYGGGFGQWSQGPVRRQLNLYPQSRWNGGGHDHGHNHGHNHNVRRNNNSGFYFGNRDFSLGIRF